MNEELIDNLALKCCEENGDYHLGSIRSVNQNKFAELIIEEVVRFTQTEYRRNWDFSWRDDFTGEIKKHFGVE